MDGRLSKYEAIDPIALILHGRALDIWYLIHHPHEPSIDEIKNIAKYMTKAQKEQAALNAKALAAYGKTIVKIAETVAANI